MKKITGPVFEKVVLKCPSSDVTGHQEITCLRRSNLWDAACDRPDDRVPAVRMAGVEGLERGYAMHRILDRHCWLDDQARETYTKGLHKYRHLLTPKRRPIRKTAMLKVLRDWPSDWRRFAGEHGAVPLDAVVIALVAMGFDPPKTFDAVVDLMQAGIPTNSGGYTTDWVLLLCPASTEGRGSR